MSRRSTRTACPCASRSTRERDAIAARVWKLQVGRSTLLLLDSDVEGNKPEDRDLTARLYGGDSRVRIRQELLLGVGGVRVLHALGISPGVVHLNEGHSAFATLELIRQRMECEGINAHEAGRRVAAQVVFTTHTPVPAGHDRFSPDLLEEHVGPLREALRLDQHELMALGRVDPDNPHESFCMTVLAMKLSHRANAVSSLHGNVSRAMWMGLFPGRTDDQVPIGHITNGIHVPTWLAPQMRQVYARAGTWDQVDRVDDGELWETHQTLKTRLIEFARREAVQSALRRGEPAAFVEQVRQSLSLDALTIGFARRFATYKRAALVLQDVEALVSLVNDPRLPVQFVFAGKAHPHDEPGKQILQQIAGLMRDPRFRGQAPVRRGLRLQCRPSPGAGRGRVAQYAETAARGVGHQRPEGRPQRRPEPVDPRRLVGRGLRRPQRLRDRQRRNAQPPSTSTIGGTATRCCACCAMKWCRSTTSATAMACRAAGSRE